MKKTKLAVTLTTSALLASQLAAQNREGIRPQLAQIEPTKVEDRAMGAMCYEIAIEPERMEYTCPICGERSFHAACAGLIDDQALIACRRLLQELPLREMFTLDETSFCKKCRPEAKKPELVLCVRYNDGATDTIHGTDAGSMTLLTDVLSGRRRTDDPEIQNSPLAVLTRLGQLVEKAKHVGTGTSPRP